MFHKVQISQAFRRFRQPGSNIFIVQTLLSLRLVSL